MEKILKYFTENKLLVNLIIITITIFGVISMINLRQDLYPVVTLNKIMITVVYPGASATDVELNAVVPVEKKLETIKGIAKYWSVSNENSAIIFVEIDDLEKDQKKIKDDIYRELASVPDMSKDVDELKIVDMNPEQIPVLDLGVYLTENSNLGEKELNNFTDILENRLSKLQNVSNVIKNGYRDREIKINVIPEKMDNFQIPLSEVVGSIASRNVRVTGGTLKSEKGDKTIVTLGQFEDPMDVRDVIIRSNFENNRVRIDDIANIEDSFKKGDIEVRINSKKGISLVIQKKSNSDIVKSVAEIKNFLKSFEKEIPEGIEIKQIYDMSLNLKSLLNVLISNAIMGFILVILVLYLFLMDIRTAFWTAFTIPMTIFMTFIYMRFIGYSLNTVTLGAMITVIGMLVDHGIVISDVVYEYKLKGYSPTDSVIKGIKDVFAPVALSIITTIVAFIPMFSIKGLMGKFIYAFPTLVIFSILASFFDATFLLPNHLMNFKHSEKLMRIGKKTWFDNVAVLYEKSLKKVLNKRYIVIASFVLIFIFTIFISMNTIKNFVLFDDESADLIYVELEAPKGTSMEKTAKNSQVIENIIKKIISEKELMAYKTIAGHHITDDFDHKGYHENWALMEVYLVPKTQRKRTATEIVKVLREETGKAKIKEFNKIKFQKISMQEPPTGSPVDIKIIGENINDVNSVKEEIKKFLSGITGVVDIEDDQKDGKPELRIVFNYEKMAQLGINTSTVALTVRTAYEGMEASSIQTPKKELDFRVKIDDSFQKDQSFLENLLIPSERYGRLVRLKEIAKFEDRKSLIYVSHYNGDKVVTVNAKLEGDKTTSKKVSDLVKKEFSDIGIKHPGIYLKYAGESEETEATMGDLGISFVLALLLIYFVLILLFKSIGEPLIVMITIPFGIIGALLGFVTHGVPLTFLGVVGIIGLSGVVVNNAIVMVDFINKAVREIKNKKQLISAITTGAKNRLRSVLLTTITTVAGLLPTAYGIGGYSAMLVPIALALAYGLLFATLLTLFFIPSLYLVRLDFNDYIKKGNFIVFKLLGQKK